MWQERRGGISGALKKCEMCLVSGELRRVVQFLLRRLSFSVVVRSFVRSFAVEVKLLLLLLLFSGQSVQRGEGGGRGQR